MPLSSKRSEQIQLEQVKEELRKKYQNDFSETKFMPNEDELTRLAKQRSAATGTATKSKLNL